jgi:hypothetical protein
MVWGSIITSVMASLAFLAAILISYLSKDQTNLAMLLGVVAGGFNTVIGYWLGSSAGSQRKDDAILKVNP